MPDPQIDVSVVVPTYGRSAQFRRLLDSIDRIEPGTPFEVVIVDDCSPDNTEAVVQAWLAQEHPFPARYLRLDRNQGPAAARNEGTRIARGRWVAYTDSDCVVDPAWLRVLPRKLAADSSLAAVGGQVLPLNPNGVYSKYNTVNGTLVPNETVNYLITANACYVRERVLEVGGFDTDVRKPGGEDVALSIKLGMAGWRFAYEPEAVVYHDYQESFRHFVRTWKNYAVGNGYVVAKYCGNLPENGNTWHHNSLRPPWMSWSWTRHVLGIQRVKCRAHSMRFGQTAKFVALRYVQMFVHCWYFQTGEEAFSGKRPLSARLKGLFTGFRK
jgi:glycosyltransferase involved in cell wall biosynthesis